MLRPKPVCHSSAGSFSSPTARTTPVRMASPTATRATFENRASTAFATTGPAVRRDPREAQVHQRDQREARDPHRDGHHVHELGAHLQAGELRDARMPLGRDAPEHREEERRHDERRPRASRPPWEPWGRSGCRTRAGTGPPRCAKSANSSAPRSCTSDPNRVSLRTWLMPVASPSVVEHAGAEHASRSAPPAGSPRRASPPPPARRTPPRRCRAPRPAPCRARSPLAAGERRRAGRPDEPAEGEQAHAARPGPRSRGSASWCPTRRSPTARPIRSRRSTARPGGSPTPKTRRPGTTCESAPRIW